jgi:outer membrane protein OmpA-like peptidoglycan-associated protein
VRIYQEGHTIKAVFVEVDPAIQKTWGYAVGDVNMTGTIEGRTISGKANAHHPVIPFKSECPEIWAHWTDIELTISPDGNTLDGRWKNRTHEEVTCRLTKEEWATVRYVRPPAPDVKREAGGFRVSLPEAILFDFDKSELKPGAQDVLGQVLSGIINQHPTAKLIVEGHTDDRGSAEYNQLLSDRRAQSVAFWLAQHGVAQSRLETRGYGKSRPKYPNDTEEHRYGNRRVEIAVRTSGSDSAQK